MFPLPLAFQSNLTGLSAFITVVPSDIDDMFSLLQGHKYEPRIFVDNTAEELKKKEIQENCSRKWSLDQGLECGSYYIISFIGNEMI